MPPAGYLSTACIDQLFSMQLQGKVLPSEACYNAIRNRDTEIKKTAPEVSGAVSTRELHTQSRIVSRPLYFLGADSFPAGCAAPIFGAHFLRGALIGAAASTFFSTFFGAATTFFAASTAFFAVAIDISFVEASVEPRTRTCR